MKLYRNTPRKKSKFFPKYTASEYKKLAENKKKKQSWYKLKHYFVHLVACWTKWEHTFQSADLLVWLTNKDLSLNMISSFQKLPMKHLLFELKSIKA